MNLYNKLRLIPDIPRLVMSRLNEIEHRQEQRLSRMVELSQRPAPPMVTVIAFGTRHDGAPMVVIDAKTAFLGTNSETIVFQAQIAVKTFQIVVLADLSRVELQGIFLGARILGALGDVPFAWGENWEPGVIVRTIVRARS